MLNILGGIGSLLIVIALPLFTVWIFGKPSDIMGISTMLLSLIAVGFVPLVFQFILSHNILNSISWIFWTSLAVLEVLLLWFFFWLNHRLYESELESEEPLYSLRFASFKTPEKKTKK